MIMHVLPSVNDGFVYSMSICWLTDKCLSPFLFMIAQWSDSECPAKCSMPEGISLGYIQANWLNHLFHKPSSTGQLKDRQPEEIENVVCKGLTLSVYTIDKH